LCHIRNCGAFVSKIKFKDVAWDGKFANSENTPNKNRIRIVFITFSTAKLQPNRLILISAALKISSVRFQTCEISPFVCQGQVP